MVTADDMVPAVTLAMTCHHNNIKISRDIAIIKEMQREEYGNEGALVGIDERRGRGDLAIVDSLARLRVAAHRLTVHGEQTIHYNQTSQSAYR